jgi:hypothetical protein
LEKVEKTWRERLVSKINKSKSVPGGDLLQIESAWTYEQKQTFKEGLSRYKSPASRAIYADLVGLTQNFLASATVGVLVQAVSNLQLRNSVSEFPHNAEKMRRAIFLYLYFKQVKGGFST